MSRSGERRRWPIGLRRASTCLSAIPGWFRPASTRPTSRPSAGLKQIGSGWAVSCAIPNTRLGTPLLVFPGCVGYGAWGARSSPRKPTYQHIFGSGETGVTAWTPIEIPVYYPYESVDIWCRSRPGEKESYPYMHDKIRDPGERYPCAGPYGGLAACGSDEPSERPTVTPCACHNSRWCRCQAASG